MREKLFFVTLSIAILLLAIPAWGQIYSYEDTVTVMPASGEAGDTLMIPIDLKNTFHVGGFLFRITYGLEPAGYLREYLHAITFVSFLMLTVPAMRPLPYRMLVSIPAAFYLAGTLLCLPWVVAGLS